MGWLFFVMGVGSERSRSHKREIDFTFLPFSGVFPCSYPR